MNDRHASTGADKLHRFIDEAAGIGGGAGGAALGLLAGDPATSVLFGGLAAAATSALRNVGHDFADRVLAPRERARVGTVLGVIDRDIRLRLERGDELRADGFFDSGPEGRSEAAEVAESVLLKSQREPQERKIPHMGHFFANVAFRPDVSAAMAHQLANQAEQLTYRQFCILRIATARDRRFRLRQPGYRDEMTYPLEQQQVIHELYDLANRQLVHLDDTAALILADAVPRARSLQDMGATLAALLSVDLVPDEDVVQIIESFE